MKYEEFEKERESERQRNDVVITMVYVRWSIITQFCLTKTTFSSFRAFIADRTQRSLSIDGFKANLTHYTHPATKHGSFEKVRN